MIAAIYTVDGSTLGDNLITSKQVDCMLSALISAEAVENVQEHITSCTVRTTNLFRQLLPKGEDLPVWDFRKLKIFLSKKVKKIYIKNQ